MPAPSTHIYTDGSSGKDGSGGWAFVAKHPMKDGFAISGYGSVEGTTNNAMELYGVYRALVAMPPVCWGAPVYVHTDSMYVVNALDDWIYGWLVNKWKTADGKHVQNKAMIMHLHTFRKESPYRFSWVKGHKGDLLNSLADRMALWARVHVAPSVLNQITPLPQLFDNFP